MAKSHSFSSEKRLTWRGVISCSARFFKASGRSGGCSSAISSPSTRTVGGRPTLRWMSEPLRLIISCSTALKLIPPDGAPAAAGAAVPGPEGAGACCAGLAIRIDPEQRLAVLDGLRVLDEDLAHDARELGLDFVHDLHRLDDAQDLALLDAIADRDVGLRSRLR